MSLDQSGKNVVSLDQSGENSCVTGSVWGKKLCHWISLGKKAMSLYQSGEKSCVIGSVYGAKKAVQLEQSL